MPAIRVSSFTTPRLSPKLVYTFPVRTFSYSSIRIMAQEYKLKGITSLDIKENDKHECEVEGIEDGKVLLVNSGGKVHAMSAKCTHYGAPLKLGVVNHGRITCAWHGACFNINSGDVEDAPALDPLAKFEVQEKDGAVYIKGDEKTIKASRRPADHKCSTTGQDKLVIVGGYALLI